MNKVTLLPADLYTVINKTILTDYDRNTLISLYEPIIGPVPVSMYLTLWRDLDSLQIISKDYTHHHLMTILKNDIETVKTSREALESVGLIKTFVKLGDINSYVYELYSPLSPKEFLSHPVLNIVLYNNIGKIEYNNLKSMYEVAKFDLKEYEDISKNLNVIFKSVPGNLANIDSDNYKGINNNKDIMGEVLDFDLIISSLPKGIVNDHTFNKRMKNLLNSIAFVYNYDSIKMIELIRTVIDENGLIDKEEIRKKARKYYQYENSGSLPTLMYRTQPEYLKSPSGDNSNRGKMIMVFENTIPYDFLRSKYKGVKPTARDLKLLDTLAIDLELKPAVINVLIDYILRTNNNKLTQGFVETIAGQWKRMGIETANEAMEAAEKEHKKYAKKNIIKNENKAPMWFDSKNEKEEATTEEINELENMLKEFR